MDTSWVGRQLKAERVAAGMTRGRLGSAAGVSLQTIERIENAKRPGNTNQLAALCAALGISLGTFFTRAEERRDTALRVGPQQ